MAQQSSSIAPKNYLRSSMQRMPPAIANPSLTISVDRTADLPSAFKRGRARAPELASSAAVISFSRSPKFPRERQLTATILDGNAIRDQIYAELQDEIAALRAAGIRPGLAAVLVGDNPASQHLRQK